MEEIIKQAFQMRSYSLFALFSIFMNKQYLGSIIESFSTIVLPSHETKRLFKRIDKTWSAWKKDKNYNIGIQNFNFVLYSC